MAPRCFLAITVALLLAAFGEARAETARGEGAACSDVIRCQQGLLCIDERCQRSAVEETREEAALGGDGEPCSERTPCRDGFLCMEGACASGASSRGGEQRGEAGGRRRAGTRRQGQSCEAQGDCRTGLACVDGACEVYTPQILVSGDVDPESGGIRQLDVGESCRPSDICGTGLLCIDGHCMRRRPADEVVEYSPPSFYPGTGPEGGASPAPQDALPPRSGWSAFALEGVHGLVGLSLGTGLTGFSHSEHGFETATSLVASVRAGLMVGRWEVALELAPYSMFLSFDGDMAIGLVATGGWLAPLARRLSWPLRLGVGLSLGRDPLFERDLFPALQLRADVIGLVFQIGHILLELTLPSVRYHPMWEGNHIWPGTETSDSDQTWCLGDAGCGTNAPPDAGTWLFLFTLKLTYVI